ncbi:SPOR domain-containing protein [Rhizobium sp. BK418]|uniref:SPOR domain-containing protein n=1 Tax=Rhizobium sp. BK418 TaxID=2512120 RepID=UPI0010431E17|nr:SPOR domain-containing protein [Rhizobium sp. BK418]
MADKRLAYDTRGKDEMFADDDPLAELARIVGFEPRVAANTVSEPERQEPALDLEDELLREFERYDTPRPLAALDHPADPVAQEVDTYDYVEPVQDEVPSIGEELDRSVATDFETPIVEPELPEAAAAAPEVEAPEPVAPAWDVPVATDWTPAPSKPAAVPVEPPVTFTAYGGARDLIEELELSIGGALPPEPVVQPPAKAPQWSAASIRLPLANFHAPRREEPVVEAPVVEPAPVEAFVAEPAFTVEPEVVAPDVAEEPLPIAAAEAADFEPAAASFGFPAEIDRHEMVPLPEQPVASFEEVAAFEEPAEPANSGFDLIAAAAEGDVHPDAALTEAPPEPAFDADAFDLDDLLADVSRYPVPQRASSPVGSEPVATVPEPVVAPPAQQSAPVPAAPVFESPVFEAPVFEAPVFEAPAARAPVQPTVIAPVPMSRATPVLRQPEAPKPVVRAPMEPISPPIAPAPVVARQPEQETEDSFAGHDFELDLAGIELELADLDFSEPPAPQPEAAAEPVRVAPVVAAQPAPRPQPAPVFVPEPQPAPVSYAKPAPAGESTDDLPFDPSMISDPEDRPETVEDMHVPTLPPVEHPEPVAKTADFDFDLDAEIASFFEPAKRQEKTPPTPAWAPPATPAAAAVAKPANSVFADGLDDFERALEEDFRRSVREPVERRENVSEVHIESASQTADFNRARSMRRLLAAAALLVVFAGGAYGVYSWVSNGPGLSIVSSGEPRVIAADKDPVKVVPENPGGKTVPNQDKAVYDRVAGAAEEPKQKALVSSDEAPVDVVQRTLTPEVSPDDDEGSADPIMPTAVGETQDPRLLPDHSATADASASGDDAAPSVSPRKVRTMIVKPDGTLVAREEPAPAEKSAPANEVASAANPAQPATTPSAASFPASTGNQTASAALPPVGTPPVGQPAQTAAKVAEVNAANANQVDPPVRPVKTTPVTDAASAATTDTAPVPTARPVDQPVNVVGTVTENGNVRPTAQQKPTQVASATPPAAAAQPAPAVAAGGYGIQIASLPSEDEAKKSYASLSKKFAGVLSGRAYEIRKADIAGKGTFYRVRIPAGSKDEAAALCEQYRSAGGSCLISK